MKRTLLILTFLSLVLIACTKEEVANHKLSLDKLFVTATANGGVEEITVTTTGEWKASITGHVDWVRIKNVNFGTGDGVIAIEFSENNGEYRTAELVVSLADGTKPRTVSLNQEAEKGTPVVSIVQPEEIFPFTVGEYKVSYYSNIVADDLQISCEASWLKSPSLDGSYITFTLEEFIKYVENWGLNLNPYDYQYKAAWLILAYRQSLSQLATRAGKTLIAYMVFRYMLENGAHNILMVVPNTSLVKQAVKDMQEYKEFFKSETVWAGGELCEGSNLTVGTFQSLVKRADKRSTKYDPKFFDKYDIVLVDEAHTLKCESINKILNQNFMKNVDILL